MRVPTRSAGTRSGVNWSRLNDPPSASASVLTVSVLARPGHALEQHVAAGQERDEQALEHRLLADDHALDLEQRGLERGVRLARRVVAARRRSRAGGGRPSCHQSTRPARAHSLGDFRAGCRASRSTVRLFAVALELDLDLVAGALGRARSATGREGLRIVLPPIDGDDVAGADAGLVGGRAVGHGADDRAGGVGLLGAREAELRAVDLAALDQLRHDVLDGVDGTAKPTPELEPL